MRSIQRTRRYLEATRVFGSVTAGRAARNAETLVREVEGLGGRLPHLASRGVSKSVAASGTVLWGSGRVLRSLAERLDTTVRR